MTKRFENQTIVLVGATGGLARAYADAFRQEGAKLVLAARQGAKLDALARKRDERVYEVDLMDAESIQRLVDALVNEQIQVDVVINATGFDVRKPLVMHHVEEINRSIGVNLSGAILLTRALVPLMQRQGSGTIVHMGGFADGRLAFPYYSVDVATRAGLYSFVESMNRELHGSSVRLLYFSPSPADTVSERPYHALWRELGQAIVPPENVARELVNAVAAKRQVHIMGGALTRLFAKLNAILPAVADVVLLNHYRDVLKAYLVHADGKEIAPNVPH